jgi:hypothetical protein
MNENIRRIAEGIKQAEGWFIGSRSWKNHNPGNLTYSIFQQGHDGQFSVFIDDNVGFFALMYDIWKKCKGQSITGLKPNDTLEKLLQVYSAAEGVEFKNYILKVEQVSGIKRDTKLKDII